MTKEILTKVVSFEGWLVRLLECLGKHYSVSICKYILIKWYTCTYQTKKESDFVFIFVVFINNWMNHVHIFFWTQMMNILLNLQWSYFCVCWKHKLVQFLKSIGAQLSEKEVSMQGVIWVMKIKNNFLFKQFSKVRTLSSKYRYIYFPIQILLL